MKRADTQRATCIHFSLALALCRLAIGIVLVGAAGGARAQPCPVELDGRLSEGWHAATTVLQADDTPEDCARVALAAAGDGRVQLTFVTRDGREATRVLNSPEELAPAVRALGVTVPKRPPVNAVASAAPSTHATPAPKDDKPTAPEAPSPVAPDRPVLDPDADLSARLGLSLGARAGAASLLSPLLQLSAVIDLWRFQLVLTGNWEAMYLDLQTGSSYDRSAALAASIGLAHRLSLGAVELAGGARLGLAAIVPSTVEERAGEPVTGNGGNAFEQWRAGGFLVAAFPRRARFRVRCQLGLDAAFAQGYAAARSLSPSWALESALGVEVVL